MMSVDRLTGKYFRNRGRVTLVLATLIAVLALAMRLPGLDRFLTPDEMKWACRSVNFYRGLTTGRFDQTYQTGHPGVITMWVGVPAMGIDPNDDWLEICVDSRTRDIIQESPIAVTRRLAGLVFTGRVAIAVTTSLLLALTFVATVWSFGLPIGLITASFLLTDWFSLALSRVLHVDALQTGFGTLSVLALVLASQHGSKRLVVLSGLLAGLAMLSKSPAMFLFPFTVLVLAVEARTSQRSLRGFVWRSAMWAVACASVYVLLWPAMWVAPIRTFQSVIQTAMGYAADPHNASNFFWGMERPDPGLLFYPIATIFRLSPWTTLGVALALPTMVRRGRQDWRLWLLLSFVVLYAGFMTAGEKKFDRYILPAFPALQVLAAVGFYRVFGGLKTLIVRTRVWRLIAVLSAIVFFISSVAQVAVAYPYYFTYYNPIVGGPAAATRTLLVGWGEGLEKAAAALNAIPEASTAEVAVRGLPQFAPFYDGRSCKEDQFNPAETDYAVLYINEVQRNIATQIADRFYGKQEPIETVEMNGVTYAWVYENLSYVEPLEYLRINAREQTDVIVVDRPGLLPEHYRGALPLLQLDPVWSHAQRERLLQDAADRFARIWTVSFVGDDPDPVGEELDRLLETHWFIARSVDFGDYQVRLWDTKGSLSMDQDDATVYALDYGFADDLRLISYTVHGAGAQYGRGMLVSLEWEVIRRPERYYAVNVNILDQYGHRWGQGAAYMVDADLAPTVYWDAGRVVTQDLVLRLSPSIAPGQYAVEVSVYDRITGAELVARSKDETWTGSVVSLPSLSVVASPKRVDPATDIKIQNVLNTEMVPGLTLWGWQGSIGEPLFGDSFDLVLTWQATAPLADNYGAKLLVVGEQGDVLVEIKDQIGGRAYQTQGWEVGEVIAGYHRIEIPKDARATYAHLVLKITDGDGAEVGSSTTLARFPVRGHVYTPPAIAFPQPAVIGELAFLGSDYLQVQNAGTDVGLVLYWRLVEPVSKDLKVFCHLIDSDGKVIAQQDSMPMMNRYPTSQWELIEYVEDLHLIQIGPEVPPGEYRLAIGLYDPSNPTNRERVIVNGVAQPGDQLILDHSITLAQAH